MGSSACGCSTSGASVSGLPAARLGRRVDRLLLVVRLGGRLGLVLARQLRVLLAGGLCLGAGDVEGPADVDDVGVGQLGAARLGDAGGGVVDLHVAVGVAELLLGDVAEGVRRLHGVGVGLGVGARQRGELEHPSGLEEAGAGAEQVAVELDDLLVPRPVTEVLVGDRPQALPRPDRVADRLLPRGVLLRDVRGRLLDRGGLVGDAVG